MRNRPNLEILFFRHNQRDKTYKISFLDDTNFIRDVKSCLGSDNTDASVRIRQNITKNMSKRSKIEEKIGSQRDNVTTSCALTFYETIDAQIVQHTHADDIPQSQR